jgi:hypothetical protein
VADRRRATYHGGLFDQKVVTCHGCGATGVICKCRECVREWEAKHCLCGVSFVDVVTGREDIPPAT